MLQRLENEDPSSEEFLTPVTINTQKAKALLKADTMLADEISLKTPKCDTPDMCKEGKNAEHISYVNTVKKALPAFCQAVHK